jgi:hypothetical protein
MYASFHNHKDRPVFFAKGYPLLARAVHSVLYKPNATINMQYRALENEMVLVETPAHLLVETARQIASELAVLQDPLRIDMVYNPVGKVLVENLGELITGPYAKYISRVHNLDGQMRLLRVQLDIYHKKVAVSNIRSYLEKSPSDLLDPYRNKPFRWEPTTRELWFEGVNPKSETDALTNQRIGYASRGTACLKPRFHDSSLLGCL